jgi:hypothetical protein
MASFSKLTGAPDSTRLFETLGVEPWGRYLVGLGELTAIVLILRPTTAAKGGALAMIMMLGAIGTHLFKIGVNYQGDGGTLFGMAVTVFVASAVVVKLRR